MKKQIYMLACASVLVAGCSSEDDILQKPSLEPTPQETPETFSITASFDGVTRTHTDPTNHLKSLWTSSDKIYIGEASTMAPYTVSSLTNDGATAIFAGTTAFSEGSYAVYGGTASSAPSIDGDKKVMGITVPSSWTYDKTNDCANVLLMGEVNTSSQTITFKHAGGVLYVDLGAYATSFKAIKITSGISTTNSSAVNISGAATITWNATNQYPTYTCAEGTDSKTITISASGSSFEADTKIIVPVPAATYGKLTVDACMVNGTEFDNQILSISDVTIERKKSYTVTFTGTPVTSVGDAATLISALNNTAGCNVKLSDNISDNPLTLDSEHQAFNISGTNATVVDLNGKTLTAQKDEDNNNIVALKLYVGSGSATAPTPFSQSFTLKNGNVVIDSDATKTELTITNACNIYFDHVNFTVPTDAVGTTYEYTIKLNINNEILDSNGNSYGNSDGTTPVNMIYFNYTGCKINDTPMVFEPFFINANFSGGKFAEKTLANETKIILNVEVNRTSGSSN